MSAAAAQWHEKLLPVALHGWGRKHGLAFSQNFHLMRLEILQRNPTSHQVKVVNWEPWILYHANQRVNEVQNASGDEQAHRGGGQAQQWGLKCQLGCAMQVLMPIRVSQMTSRMSNGGSNASWVVQCRS